MFKVAIEISTTIEWMPSFWEPICHIHIFPSYSVLVRSGPSRWNQFLLGTTRANIWKELECRVSVQNWISHNEVGSSLANWQAHLLSQSIEVFCELPNRPIENHFKATWWATEKKKWKTERDRKREREREREREIPVMSRNIVINSCLIKPNPTLYLSTETAHQGKERSPGDAQGIIIGMQEGANLLQRCGL